GIDDGGIDVGEDLEFVCAAHVIAVAAGAIADDTAAIGGADLAGLEGFDHAGFGRAADPAVAFDAHGEKCPGWLQAILSSCRPVAPRRESKAPGSVGEKGAVDQRNAAD